MLFKNQQTYKIEDSILSLKRYYNHGVLTKDGSLADVSLDLMNRASANDPADLPGVQVMLHALEGITGAQGHNARSGF